jgi:hypothetical protein
MSGGSRVGPVGTAIRWPAVRLADPGDAPSVALLLHNFNREFDEPVPEPGELARRLRGLLESAAITVLLVEGEGLVVRSPRGRTDRLPHAYRPGHLHRGRPIEMPYEAEA